jgi:hypothetical protein
MLCCDIPLAPAASLLAETLHTIGTDVAARQTLSRWMEQTADMLRAFREQKIKPGEKA